MSRRRIALVGWGLLAMVLVGCSSPPPLALVASSPGSIGTGAQRILIGLLDPDSQEFLAAPELEATATFVGPSEQEIAGVPLEFVWAVPDVRGLYRAIVDIPVAGGWSVTVEAEGMAPTDPTVLVASADLAIPGVGEAAPPEPTRTRHQHDLSQITTDPDPDPSFYELSLDEALADDRPTVVVFATPAFCTSQTCGPVLDIAKEVARSHPGVDFIHVEVYENLDAATFEDLVPVSAVEVWALPSEPWVFVTDTDGVVTAAFEGTYDAAELTAALADLER